MKNGFPKYPIDFMENGFIWTYAEKFQPDYEWNDLNP